MPRRSLAVEIGRAEDGKGLGEVRRLFREYASAVARDLTLHDFAEELAGLPGEYAAPGGALLLATWDRRPAGCVGLRPLSADACEMKRLFVRHQFRGKGVGKRLALAVIETARDAGYRSIRLNLSPWMEEAIALYRALGFRELEAHRGERTDGAVAMELALH